MYFLNIINIFGYFNLFSNLKKELRNYLSMERLHEIFLNENFDSAILQQGQNQQHEAMQHHCFL